MSDNISRQAAIKETEGREMSTLGDWSGYSAGYNDALNTVVIMLEDLPSTDDWIPCSKRLPRYGEDVLTFRPTMAMKMVVDSYMGFYGEDDSEWYEGWGVELCECKEGIVTAWMPLPSAYKGEQ